MSALLLLKITWTLLLGIPLVMNIRKIYKHVTGSRYAIGSYGSYVHSRLKIRIVIAIALILGISLGIVFLELFPWDRFTYIMSLRSAGKGVFPLMAIHEGWYLQDRSHLPLEVTQAVWLSLPTS
jgi:hypothetical protein